MEVLFRNLKDKKVILFGPFIGQYTFELFKWAGFIRWFKKENPKKQIIVCSRNSSKDLYTDCVDNFLPLELEGDYDKISPSGYFSEGLTPKMFSNINEMCFSKFPNIDFICSPLLLSGVKNVFNVNNIDFDFTPRGDNKLIVENIIKSSDIGDKKIICISTRSRNDKNRGFGNWDENAWNDFFDRINKSNKFFAITLGKQNTIVKSEGRPNIVNITDYITKSNNNKISESGLSIEAIKASSYTIGTQSSNIILSNILKTPTIFFGNKVLEYSEIYNPYNTFSLGVPNILFDMSPETMYNIIINQLFGVRNTKFGNSNVRSLMPEPPSSRRSNFRVHRSKEGEQYNKYLNR